MTVASAKRTARRDKHGYLVAQYPNQAVSKALITPRRGASLSIPLLNWDGQVKAQDELFSMFGLDTLVGCTTAEMSSRPIPHVFKRAKVDAVTKLYEKWFPLIMRRLIPEVKPLIQTLNKVSRLGWPEFTVPESKTAALEPYVKLLDAGQTDWLQDAFVTMNVRIQPESKEKERDFMFLNRDGGVYEATISGKRREVLTPAGNRIAGRTRGIFNYPTANLYKQVWDTCIHHVILKYPLCGHNMFQKHTLKHSGEAFAFDVKHMERYTGAIVRVRAALLGGMYGQIDAIFGNIPYLVPSDSWKQRTDYLLWPDHDSGYMEQFGSGDSAVAPSQKELFIALIAEFANAQLNIPLNDAINWALAGGDSRITFLNYGDDNCMFGDQSLAKSFMDYCGQYLLVEPELPPKFLGFLWTSQGWRLGKRSYLEKTYLNERRPFSAFRPYPCMGWILKKQVYAEYGEPDIVSKVFPTEREVLKKHGLEWGEVEAKAEREKQGARDAFLASKNLLLGKDYAMTAEEKLATGLFEGWQPDRTGPIIKNLIGAEWQKLLR